MNPYEIIRRPHVSEKSVHLQNKIGAYTFDVHPHANKVQIKAAVEKLFGKTVISVNTANYDGKKKRQRQAAYGRTAHWKKAIVTLKAGEKIDLA